MRITVKQLKNLVREAVEDMNPMDLEREAKNVSRINKKEDLFQLYSDMYKEMYNIRPRWLKLEDVTEDELRALIEKLEEDYPHEMEERKREAEQQEKFFHELEREHEKEEEAEEKAKEELEKFGYEDLEDLPKKSGMSKRLEETIKNIVREAVKEKKEEEKKPKGKQKKLDVAPPFGKLDKHDFERLGKISKSKAKKKEED